MLRVFFNTERCVGFRTGFATEDSFAERRGRLFITHRPPLVSRRAVVGRELEESSEMDCRT